MLLILSLMCVTKISHVFVTPKSHFQFVLFAVLPIIKLHSILSHESIGLNLQILFVCEEEWVWTNCIYKALEFISQIEIYYCKYIMVVRDTWIHNNKIVWMGIAMRLKGIMICVKSPTYHVFI